MMKLSDISVLSGLLVLLAIFKTESTNGNTILLGDGNGLGGSGAGIRSKRDIIQPTDVLGEQKIETFHVTTDIRYRFATTTMCSIVRNTASVDKELTFNVNLPKEAFIVKFNMMIDGKDYEGEVKEKEEAKKQYTEAKARGESAGHIRQTPRHANRFDMSVNVAGGKTVNFTLVYQELLSRSLGLYEYEMHVDPGQAVEDFKVEVTIFENRPLLFVKTPRLRTESLLTNEAEVDNDLTSVERPTKNSALIKYYPTVDQQGTNGLSARFVVQYDVEHAEKGTLLVADGYFIHLFAAKPEESLPKDIIFVLDTSGSMSGTKIAQLRTAMETILKDLKEDDRFNIIAFSSSYKKMKSQLIQATSENIESAKRYVSTMYATGGTNINEALIKALDDLKTRESQRRVGMVFFLTDGQPTSGETNSKTIARNVKGANEETAIFSLAFGSGADLQLLKTISTQNSGFARKIYQASDAALQVERLYKEISSVAMKNVKVEYLPSKVRNTTKTVFPVLPTGGEIVIGGCIDLRPYKWRQPFFKMVGVEKEEDVVIEMDPDEIIDITEIDGTLGGDDDDVHKDYSGILEKMWAYLTVKQLLKEKEGLDGQKLKREKLDKRILELSLKYQFVSPLTSMVVTKPNNDKPTRPMIKHRESVPASNNHRFAYTRTQMRPMGRQYDPSTAHFQRPMPVVPSTAQNYYPMPVGGSRGPRRYGSARRYSKKKGPRRGHKKVMGFPKMTSVPKRTTKTTTTTTKRPTTTTTTTTTRSTTKSATTAPQTTFVVATKSTTPQKNSHEVKSVSKQLPTEPTTTTATTTTTTIPTTTPRPTTRKTKKNRGSKRSRKEKFAILTSLIIKVNGLSMCFAPKKSKPGKYILAEFTNGLKITMETKCVKRRCLMSIVNLKLVDSRSPSNNQSILNMNNPSKFPDLSNWKYDGNGLELNISQRKKGRKLFVSLEVTQKSQQVTLIDTIALLKYKEIKYPRMPRGCRRARADRTAILYMQK